MMDAVLAARVIGLGSFVVAVGACGGAVVVDPSATGSGGASSSASSASSSTSGTGGGCPAGTCVLPGQTVCVPPTGPNGSGCCDCGTNGACEVVCKCASPDTPVATPEGERAIASLRAGDLVYSVDGARIVAVPVVATHETAAGPGHHVVRVRLANGATVEMSAGHPTLDGRTFGDLRAGGALGGVEVVGVETIPYDHDRTYDILPASESGGYFAGGALVGSTLRPAARVDLER
jgi:hypothetical protein